MNMTVLEFSVSGQTMTETKRSTIVRDMSRDYIRLKFHFDESWDGLIKTVYFHTADSAYPALLASDELAVPNYYAQQEEFLILMVGIHGDTAVATNVLNISLDTAGGIWMAVPDEPPTPVYQELVNLAEAAAQSAAEAAAALASSVRSVNGKTPDTAGGVEVRSNDIKMDAGDYEDYSEESITDVVDQLGERIDAAKGKAETAQSAANAAQTAANTAGATAASARATANTAKSTAETAQSVAEAAQSAANAAVKRVNLKAPTLGSVVIDSNDILMQTGAYEDYYGETITHTIDDLGERIDSKGGKVELVRSGNQILRKGAALTFGEIRELLTVKPDFVYLLDGDWAYLTTYIYGQPTDAYQYILFASTVIGDLRTKTSSIMVQTTNGGVSYTVTSSTINNENVSNKSDMSVLNDTRYPTTKSVADYVAAQLAAIPFAEGVTFGG